MRISDGTGAGYQAKVNSNFQMESRAETRTEDQSATKEGNAYNINSGLISCGATDSTLLYVKNNETENLDVDAIAVGVGTVAVTPTDSVWVTVIRNPTGGDLISDATAVDINGNRNFGSSNTLSVDAYKGKSGGTITGGNDLVLLQMSGAGRLFAAINMVLTPGDSIAIKIDLNTSASGTNVYGAVVCHKDV